MIYDIISTIIASYHFLSGCDCVILYHPISCHVISWHIMSYYIVCGFMLFCFGYNFLCHKFCVAVHQTMCDVKSLYIELLRFCYFDLAYIFWITLFHILRLSLLHNSLSCSCWCIYVYINTYSSLLSSKMQVPQRWWINLQWGLWRMFLSAWHPVASRRNTITHPGSARENWWVVCFLLKLPQTTMT